MTHRNDVIRRHEFRADRVDAAQGFAEGGVERLKRKEQIDGLKAEVLSLRAATAVDVRRRAKVVSSPLVRLVLYCF